MDTRHKILLLDDDPDLLEVYGEMLAQLPSRPEIRTASAGARAIAMLEAEPFRLLISDLKMPKMDGLQVLSIVRRKYPQLRTVVLTSVNDEQFRSRVYALGVDQFWQKPGTPQEIKMFLDCLESLLGKEMETGFRGVQSKSLVDLIQLECISLSSSVLRITNGPLTGSIWINAGELVDAEVDDTRGEDAFRKILSWRTGTFETLPPDLTRPRTIFQSYNALLLESAQAMDESRQAQPAPSATGVVESPDAVRLGMASQEEGVEFLLTVNSASPRQFEARGLENPEAISEWTTQSLKRFQELGEQLQAGPLEQVIGLGPQRSVSLANAGENSLCVGWQHSLSAAEVRERVRKLLMLWAS